MKRFEFVVKEAVGIHARPAILLMKTADLYDSNISIEKNGKIADARKLMPIMSLGVKCGEKVTFTIEGPDEEKALIELKQFCDQHL